jgi:FKBP-type peptidyl-prolyl cis-trans isomerase
MNFIRILLIVVLYVGCSNKPKKVQSNSEIKVALEKANKQIVKDNSNAIDAYILRNHWKVEESGTGLRYFVYKKGKGKKIKSGDKIILEYSLKTLDGIEIINDKKSVSKPFIVEKENAESGIHEVLQLLNKGDNAKVILPPHLAFGLTGNEEIPPMATLVYNLKVSE